MFYDSDQKQKRRDDAIYNPIEGKWEKRRNRTIDNTIPSEWENKLKLNNIKTMINGMKEDARKPFSAPPTELSSNRTRKMIDIPFNKLKDSIHRQELHDQKVLKMNEKEHQEAKKDDFLIIKIAIGLILLFIAART